MSAPTPDPVPIEPDPRFCPWCGIKIDLTWKKGTRMFHKNGLCIDREQDLDPDAEVDL